MDDPVISTLSGLVQQYGSALYADRARLRGLLNDLIPTQHRREINLLLQAVDVRIPHQIASANGSLDRLLAGRLAAALTNDFGTMADQAQWAVQAWATALGKPLTVPPAAPPAAHAGTPLERSAYPALSEGQRQAFRAETPTVVNTVLRCPQIAGIECHFNAGRQVPQPPV